MTENLNKSDACNTCYWRKHLANKKRICSICDGDMYYIAEEKMDAILNECLIKGADQLCQNTGTTQS